ncbi:MvaI/BcnI family restriction endonuclease (plasmid) [Clostridium perfringens]
MHYFKYDKVKLVTGLTTNALKEAIRNGDVKIDIRIGTYNSGKNLGKVHDHGTGFRISLQNLIKYADIIQL